MSLRIPRGYDRNRPYFKEVCEGVRPNSQAIPRTAYTGLPHVRIDEIAHDPIVIDAGTLVGVPTGTYTAAGTLVPAIIGTGSSNNFFSAAASQLHIKGSTDAASYWGLPDGTSGNLNVGVVKPLGVVYQPIYSFMLDQRFTNYKRVHSVGILTEYVIQIPITNDEENMIYEGDLVMLGSGRCHGQWTAWWSVDRQAGRYAKFVSSGTIAGSGNPVDFPFERLVGRCLKRTLLGTSSSCSQGDALTDVLSTFTISNAAKAEFSGLDKVQTVPGLAISGSGTKGIPAHLLGARADATNGSFYALTILIRL